MRVNIYWCNQRMQTKLCRDHVVIALADRVDAIHIRRGGKVFAAIQQRLATAMT